MIKILFTLFDFIKSETNTLVPASVGVGVGITINHISISISCFAVIVGLAMSIANYALKRKILQEEYKKLLKENKEEKEV